MSVTSYHAGKWLTSFDINSCPGQEHTISVGHPLCGGEFTTYRLGAVVAHDANNNPLFDLDVAEVQMPDQSWAPADTLRALRRDWSNRTITVNGARYERGAWGHFTLVRATAEA